MQKLLDKNINNLCINSNFIKEMSSLIEEKNYKKLDILCEIFIGLWDFEVEEKIANSIESVLLTRATWSAKIISVFISVYHVNGLYTKMKDLYLC